VSWQDAAVAIIVLCAVAYVIWKVRGTGRRPRPDVPASALVRKKPRG